MFNAVVRSYLNRWKKEIEEIKIFPDKCQKRELQKILQSSTLLQSGQNPENIVSYQDFNKKTAITSYPDYEPAILNLLSTPKSSGDNYGYVARSSGTTSGTYKLIPLTSEFVRTNLLRGSWYVLQNLYEYNKKMSVFDFKNLLVGGSVYEKRNGRIIGDVSGIMISRIPRFFQPFYIPDIETAIHPDWQYKLEKTAVLASRTDQISLLGGTPTWVLSLLRKVVSLRSDSTIEEMWPKLQAYLHGGVDFSPYRPQFDELIRRKDFRYLEIYNGTEGFYAFQDHPNREGMLLMLKNGLFYEFISHENFMLGNHNILPIWEVEIGVQYVMLISSTYGLRRYVIGDLVEFVDCKPYRLLIRGRTTEFLNAFGEDLMLHQAREALSCVLKTEKVVINEFSIAPKYITVNKQGHHEWYIEFYQAPENLDSFSTKLDKVLQSLNMNYNQKRSSDLALDPLRVISLKPGTFESYLQWSGRAGGQNKVPRIRNDREFVDSLNSFIDTQAEKS